MTAVLYPTHEAKHWYMDMMRVHGGLVMSKIQAKAQALAVEDGNTYIVSLAYYKRAWHEMLPEVSNLPGFDAREVW